MKKALLLAVLFISALSSCKKEDNNLEAYSELTQLYELYKNTPHNINEHLPTLKRLAQECNSVIEIGVERIFSTWAILHGLSHHPETRPSYLGIDIESPPLASLLCAQKVAKSNGIAFQFIQGNDVTIDIPETDLLFIDSLHTYCHLTMELETFSPKVNKYIALHDTSAPWGHADDTAYHGDYSEYPAEYSRELKGLWPAVQGFLERHPEWILQERMFNNYGFTVLARVRK